MPAVMGRFIEWRDELHGSKKLHPLLSPAHVIAYFCHIHTLRGGNERCQNSCEDQIEENPGYYVGGPHCRTPELGPIWLSTGEEVGADHMTSNHLLFRSVERREYLRMVSGAQDYKPAVGVDRAWNATVASRSYVKSL